MKKLIILLCLMLYPFFSCVGQDNQHIYIGREKIYLRYSTKNDVEKLLGIPEKTEYFEIGGEDFFWKDFTVCSYEKNMLSFHYDKNGAIIRITVNNGFSEQIHYLSKGIKSLMKEDILTVLKSFEGKPDYVGIYISNDYIGYDHKLSKDLSIVNGFWFDSIGKVLWIDMYYNSPW